MGDAGAYGCWWLWWWWLAFVVIFFFIPLIYGWGYRGWGPWYRRRRPPGTDLTETDSGWGWLGIFLWVILIVAIIWAIFAWGWGGNYQPR